MVIDPRDLFLAELRKRRLTPRNIEFTRIGPLTMVNSFDEVDLGTITDSVTTGVDLDGHVALLKSLTESVERSVLGEHLSLGGVDAIGNRRSDGTAAFPVLGDRSVACRFARQNALHEAIERYVWATWWDTDDVAARIQEITAFEYAPLLSIVDLISHATEIESIYLIEPEIAGSEVIVSILFAKLRAGGFLSGGAAGGMRERVQILLRALSEMLRHSLACERIWSRGIDPKGFYEERLMYFASGRGSAAVEKRLRRTGSSQIRLPQLRIDRELPHANDDLVCVHRCYFEGQPPFVGGALERLCL